MFTNIIHESPYYCASSSGQVKNGVLFSAAVINDPIAGQYTVVSRTDLVTGITRELRRLTAAESKAYAIQQGADPNKDNGKHGNVTLTIDGNDIILVLEVRMNSVNKPKYVVLKGYAI